MQRALSLHAMLRQRAPVTLQLPARKQQLLPLHRGLRGLKYSGAELMDRVHVKLDTEGRHGCSVWRGDVYPRACSKSLRYN